MATTGFVEDQEDDDSDSVRLSVSISTDQGGFFRRTCPVCGRDFKTEIDPSELQWALAPLVQRITREEIGDSSENENNDENQNELYCPYCCEKILAIDSHTSDTMKYIKSITLREIVLPMMQKIFSPLSNLGNQNTGLVSFSIKYDRGMLSPRPLHGPEPPDMKQIQFICCGKVAKVYEEWHWTKQCVYCGVPVILS